MDFVRILEDKKLGRALTGEQIEAFARGAADCSVPDYQLSALLMAIRLNGMDERETSDLALAMAHTGDMLAPDVGGVAVDKHSTGGVADTTTLVAVPLAAACGVKVPKMSGRGLGHTGGTIDKMESIGMRTTMTEDEFLAQVRSIGCAVMGQSRNFAPADKTLYALRDVTSTVDSLPLIASSIMSKKLASGAQGIVLDVKTGSGAMMPTAEDSIKLSQAMVSIGTSAGRHVVALVSGMHEPLGSNIGNALEVKEAVDILSGRAGGPLLEVSLKLGGLMLLAGGLKQNSRDAEQTLQQALKSGRGLERLRMLIAAQGGNVSAADDPESLVTARLIAPVPARGSGYISGMDTAEIGYAARNLGAGRIRKDDAIDYAVGIIMQKRIGDRVEKGEPLARVYANDQDRLDEAIGAISRAVTIGKKPCEKAKLLYAVVTKDGVERL